MTRAKATRSKQIYAEGIFAEGNYAEGGQATDYLRAVFRQQFALTALFHPVSI